MANHVEAAAIISRPAERLEQVRVANPDLDFAYLDYRRAKK